MAKYTLSVQPAGRHPPEMATAEGTTNMRTAATWAGLAVAGMAIVLTACETEESLVVQVTTTVDTADAAPGDGACADVDGECSLRAAIDESNANPASVTIDVPTGTYELTRPGTDDGNAGGDLDLDPLGTRVVLTAEQGGVVIRDRTNDAQVVDVHGEASLTGVAITDGAGVGLAVRDGAGAHLRRSAAAGNADAGIAVDGAATVVLENSTVTGNDGPGIANDGQATLLYATITANGDGGVARTGTVDALATIVADQTAGADCASAVTSAGYNLASDTSCGLQSPGDAEGVSADLAPAADALVPEHVAGPLSPVVDSIPVASPGCEPDDSSVDQRGEARPVGPACTKGAVESGFEVVDEVDFTSLPPGRLPFGWNDCSTAWRDEYAPLEVVADAGLGVGDAYAAVSPAEAAEGQLPGVGCVWRNYGDTATEAVSVEVEWTGAIPLEGTPLLHVRPSVGATRDIREMGLGAWPAHGLLPWCCVLLGGTLGHPPEDFRPILDALVAFGPAQPTRIAIRSHDDRYGVWLESFATGGLELRAGPLDVPIDLQGSTMHGVALDAHYATPEYPTLYSIDPMPSPTDAAISSYTVAVYSG